MDAGVANQMLDELRMRAAREQEGGARVPKIMPAYIKQPRTLQQGLEIAVDDVLTATCIRVDPYVSL